MPLSDDMTMDERIGKARYPLPVIQRAIRFFWHGYQTATKLTSNEAEELLQRGVKLSAARMIQTAYEISYQLPGLSPQSVILLQISANLLAQPERVRFQLYGFPWRWDDDDRVPHPDLLAVLDAVEIHSAASFTLGGVIVDLSSEAQQNRWRPTFDAMISPLVLALRQNLYSQLYTRPTRNDAIRMPNALARRDWMAAVLSDANSGSGTWEPGWRVQGLCEDGRVAVTKDEITFWVSLTQVRRAEEEIRAGQSCRVKIGKELLLDAWVPLAIGNGMGNEDGA